MLVKIGRVPGRIAEIVVGNNTSVEDVCRLADITIDSKESVEVNGSRSSLGATVNDGDIITVVANIKGAF